MYAKLKQLMNDHGYQTTEGDHWHASDTVSFSTFAHFVLGVPVRIAHRVLAYPHAFPHAFERLNHLMGHSTEPVSAPVAPPTQVAAPQPVAAPVEPPAPVADSTTLDISAQDQSAKQELEVPVVPPVEPATDSQESAPTESTERTESEQEHQEPTEHSDDTHSQE